MTDLITKIIVCPLTLIISDYLFRDVYYPYTYQPIFIGAVIALVGYFMELLLLRPGTVIISTIADFLASFVLVYFSQFILPGAAITLIGAVITATIFAVIEYFEHIYLVRSYKTKKSE
jgi:uncharacterized protein (DUF2062 family)